MLSELYIRHDRGRRYRRVRSLVRGSRQAGYGSRGFRSGTARSTRCDARFSAFQCGQGRFVRVARVAGAIRREAPARALRIRREAAGGVAPGGDKTGDDRFYERMVKDCEGVWKKYLE